MANMVTSTPAAGNPRDVSRMCEETGSGWLLLGLADTEDPTSGIW